METKKLVSSNPNVILTRQTCGQRSGMAAGSKRRALAFYVCIRIYYMFPVLNCKGEWNLGLCMTSGLAKRMRVRSGNFRFKNVFGHRIRRNSPVRSGFLFEGPKYVYSHSLTSTFQYWEHVAHSSVSKLFLKQIWVEPAQPCIFS